MTQVREFRYGPVGGPPGPHLLSSTNPESGTVTHTYNSDGTPATRVDAKGLKTEYGYDGQRRLIQVRRYPSVSEPEDVSAQVNLSYDTNPYEPGYSVLSAGRLTVRQYQVNGVTFKEMYGYTAPGQVAKKKLRVEKYGAHSDLNGEWEYNEDGQISKVTYPGGGVYQYGFDAMGRLKDMKDPNDPYGQWIISGATYGPAGELKTMTGVVNETRSYNERLQLTGLNGVEFSYDQTVGGQPKNNGRLIREIASGETVVYQYDELNRLVKAETEAAGGWGQQFWYDGFGNLTSKSGTPGHAAAPTMNVTVNGLTNRVAGYSYDANGNQLTTATQDLGYDYENRAVWVDNRNNTGKAYGYDPDNRRVYGASWTFDVGTSQTSYSGAEVHFWGVTGQRMATYELQLSAGTPGSVTLVAKSARAYFGGRLVLGETGAVQEDRLGSVGKFYPYGEGRVGDPKRFATYERDESGLDYAVNRYYWVGMGRFMSADQGPPVLENPASWNRYSYSWNDPVNLSHPDGRLPSSSGFVPRGGGGGFDWNTVPDWLYWGPGPIYVDGGVSLSPLQQLHFVVEALEGIPGVDVLGPAPDGAGYVLNFSTAGSATAAAGVCIAQPQLCVIVVGGTAVIYTVYVTWPHLVEIGKAVSKAVRGLRDPAIARDIPRSIPGTRDPNGDCMPPGPDQKGPAGATFKWQQRSSAPLADPSSPPRWHWTRWNFDVITCQWFYNGRGESASDPGPGYILIPGIF